MKWTTSQLVCNVVRVFIKMEKPFLLCDFDGTIVDSLAVVLDIANEVAPEFGLPEIDEEKLKALRGLSTKEFMREAALKWYQLPKLALRGKAAFKKRLPQIQPIEGMPELLHRLHAEGVRMGILTSNSKATVRQFLEMHQLDYFEFITTSRKVMGKADSLKRLIKKEGLVAHRVIMIGDEVRDIEAARACGVHIVTVSWGLNSAERLAEAKPDVLVRTVGELEEYLKKSCFM